MAVEIVAPVQSRAEVRLVGDKEWLHIEYRDRRHKDLPLLSIRDPNNHSVIADMVGAGEPAAFEAAGVFGIMSEVKNTRTPNQSGDLFWQLKRGRSPLDKVPIISLPEFSGNLIKFSVLNEEVRRVFRDGRKRNKFWGDLPLHIIAPVIDKLPIVHPETFITTPEESRQKGLEFVREPTISIYSQIDPDWEAFARSLALRAPNSLFGVSSFNYSGEHPPYNFQELIEYLPEHPELTEAIAAVVYDPATWGCKIDSSQTQIRLPLFYEPPIIYITRPGPVPAKMIEENTGFEVRVLENARPAKTRHPEGTDLTPRVYQYLYSVSQLISGRKRGITPPRLTDRLAA